jgi:hypothetical protein
MNMTKKDDSGTILLAMGIGAVIVIGLILIFQNHQGINSIFYYETKYVETPVSGGASAPQTVGNQTNQTSNPIVDFFGSLGGGGGTKTVMNTTDSTPVSIPVKGNTKCSGHFEGAPNINNGMVSCMADSACRNYPPESFVGDASTLFCCLGGCYS